MKNLMFVFDRMPDQNGCTFVEVENEEGQSVNAGEWRLRDDGLADLVVPVSYSPSFDEAKERELFETSITIDSEEAGFGEPDLHINEDGEYRQPYHQIAWAGWLACAKSRAQQ
jgi:hypothetical protein